MTDFEVFYLATDPVIEYEPAVDDEERASGWVTGFSRGLAPALSPPRDGQQGVGAPWRSTCAVDASLQFSFFGTSLAVHGHSEGVSWLASIDGQNFESTYFTFSGGVILAMGALGKPCWHAVKITLTEKLAEGGQLYIDRISFQTGYKVVEQQSLKCTETELKIWEAEKGQWQLGTIPDMRNCSNRLNIASTAISNARISAPFNKLRLYNSSKSVVSDAIPNPDEPSGSETARTPKEVAFFFLYGNLNSDHGRYRVDSHTQHGVTGRERTSHCKYAVQRALLWFGVNVGSSMVSMQATLINRDAAKLDIISLDYCIPAPTSSIGKLKTRWRGTSEDGTPTRRLADVDTASIQPISPTGDRRRSSTTASSSANGDSTRRWVESQPSHVSSSGSEGALRPNDSASMRGVDHVPITVAARAATTVAPGSATIAAESTRTPSVFHRVFGGGVPVGVVQRGGGSRAARIVRKIPAER